MIRVPTVLVVGAGASKPYNLPLGKDLLAEAKSLTIGSDVCQLLLQSREIGRKFQDSFATFQDCIQQYTGPSIDSFLQDQPQWSQIGHLVIAGLMGQAVYKTMRAARETHPIRHVDPKLDWLGYLIERMRQGAQTLAGFRKGNSQLTFVTFNFDTVIEDRFQTETGKIYNEFSDGPGVRVIHVHGTLPTLNSLSLQWIQEAAKQVRVIREELNEAAVNDARRAISEAEVVCFLGFQYDVDNLNTLDIPKTLRTDNVFGSAMDVKPGDRANVSRSFGDLITLGAETEDAKSMLENHDVIRTRLGGPEDTMMPILRAAGLRIRNPTKGRRRS